MKDYASLSLDLDNQWSYMKTHGDSGWQSLPSYLDTVVPRILEFLAARKLTITFFIVGQDAALPKNRAALASISAAGRAPLARETSRPFEKTAIVGIERMLCRVEPVAAVVREPERVGHRPVLAPARSAPP